MFQKQISSNKAKLTFLIHAKFNVLRQSCFGVFHGAGGWEERFLKFFVERKIVLSSLLGSLKGVEYIFLQASGKLTSGYDKPLQI